MLRCMSDELVVGVSSALAQLPAYAFWHEMLQALRVADEACYAPAPANFGSKSHLSTS